MALGSAPPDEGPGALVVLLDEVLDGGLQGDERGEDAALELSAGQLGEEALDGVEPRGRGGREVEGPARVAGEPGPADRSSRPRRRGRHPLPNSATASPRQRYSGPQSHGFTSSASARPWARAPSGAAAPSSANAALQIRTFHASCARNRRRYSTPPRHSSASNASVAAVVRSVGLSISSSIGSRSARPPARPCGRRGPVLSSGES